MKALTLWQPWAQIVVAGLKMVENRPWPLWHSMTGRQVAIHAGRKWDDECVRKVNDFWPKHDGLKDAIDRARANLGKVVGVVTFTDCVTHVEANGFPAGHEPWFSGPYGFIARDAREIVEGIPCKGALAFWDLPFDVEERLQAALR
jgi:hypothetical protein